MPLPIKTSAIHEKDEFYSKLVERCIEVVVTTLGSRDVRALLMIGAPARSEVTVVATPDGFYSLSDIDLVCVCSYGSNAAAMRAALVPAMADLNRELEARCSGADVSVKNEEALADPSPLISTFEMIRSPTVVWGDSRIVSALGDIDIADVPKTESLTLIHNRVTESLLFHPVPGSAQEDRKEALRRLYATAKVMLDSITAYLFLRNNVPTGFGDRVRFFTDDVLRRPESAGLLGRLSPFLDELPAWARFKTTGDLEGVAESLGGTLDDAGLIGLANGAWYRCIPYVEALWRAILTDVARRDATVQDLSAVARLYGRLENPLRSALRTKGILEPGRAPEGLLSAPRAVARARYASTKALVYLTAVLVYLSFSDALEWRLAEKLILRYCPFRFPQGFSNRSDEEKRETLIQMLDAFHRHVLLGRREN